MKILYRFGIIIVILFCLTAFLPSSSYAANTRIDVTVNPSVIAPPPVITSPITGTETSQSSITVTGTAEELSTVKIYVNSVLVASVVIGGSGSFSVSAPLTLGINSIIGTTTNIIGTSPQSIPIIVTRTVPVTPSEDNNEVVPDTPGSINAPSSSGTGTTSNTSPPSAPVIENISDQYESSKNYITLIGTAEPNSTVEITVNGKIVAVVKADDKGYFEVYLDLTEGANTISLTASNKYGKSDPTTITVFYKAGSNNGTASKSSDNGITSQWWFSYLLLGLIFCIFVFFLLIIKRRKRKDKKDTPNQGV